MSKVLTFSRVFPSYHPRKGEPTYFVEGIWKSLMKINNYPDEEFNSIIDSYLNFCYRSDIPIKSYYHAVSKHHTIRAGNRFKEGDKFSPRVWSGKPYASKQIIIAPDIEVKKTWKFEIIPLDNAGALYYQIDLNDKHFLHNEFIAANDGLEFTDFENWFDTSTTRKNGFKGQIICWNENINYQ